MPAPALGARRITGPRLVEASAPPLAASVAARALSAGLGTGQISPRVAPVQVGPAPSPGTSIDFAPEIVARRCRIKSEACRFARDRNRLGFDAVKAEYDRLRGEANTVQPCYLWAIQRDTESMDDGVLEMAQGCYLALASSVELVGLAPDDPSALELLAEAQGGVFLLLQGIEQARGDDREQRTAYAWLRGRVERGEIPAFVLDAARGVDPAGWRGLESRIAVARERLEAARVHERERRQTLKTIAYHTGRIADSDRDTPDLDHDWAKVRDAAWAFLNSGGQASDPALVESLVDVADRVPEALLSDPGIARIMPYLDARLTEREESGAGAPAPARRVTEELLRVRDMLRGRVVVLIGGKCRHESKRLIERELELKELRWISSEPHASIAPFEAEIARPEVAAVLMMIRWSSHSFEGAKEFCIRHAKPWVRVPAGYNPSQLAHQILEQQGDRLAPA